jgi:hypothetical protein
MNATPIKILPLSNLDKSLKMNLTDKNDRNN